MKYLMLSLLSISFLMFAPASAAPTATTRAAFVYGWYDAAKWDEGHVWQPVVGEYESQYMASIHVNQLQYADIDVGIYSWQGVGSLTDTNFNSYLNAGLKWAVYYELDWMGTRSSTLIGDDINYLRSHYFDHPNYYKVNGKPVVFVYSPQGTCSTAAKWASLKNNENLYISMTDIPEWWTCNNLDSWHAYRPANRVNSVYLGSTLYSVSISAGFWAAWEQGPRLSRDFGAFSSAVIGTNSYQFPWQLFYFNEWGEGTQLEPSNARCQEYLCSDYLKVLADNPQ